MNENRDIVLRIDRKSGILLAGVLAVAWGSVALSEQLTLTTSYPVPSGIYNQLITTGNSGAAAADTTFNRNAGNTILVPPTNASGNVGIGTSNPRSPAPNAAASGNLDVNDVWVRGANKWVSQSPTLGASVSPNVYNTNNGPQTHRTRHWDCPAGSVITKIWERQRSDTDWWGHIYGVECRKLQ